MKKLLLLATALCAVIPGAHSMTPEQSAAIDKIREEINEIRTSADNLETALNNLLATRDDDQNEQYTDDEHDEDERDEQAVDYSEEEITPVGQPSSPSTVTADAVMGPDVANSNTPPALPPMPTQ